MFRVTVGPKSPSACERGQRLSLLFPATYAGEIGHNIDEVTVK